MLDTDLKKNSFLNFLRSHSMRYEADSISSHTDYELNYQIENAVPYEVK
jgi:hypothetical protein